MSECICVHIGNFGIRSGQSVWKQLCFDNKIGADGCGCARDDSKSFFSESMCGHYTPHALLLDIDQTSFHELNTGAFRHFFSNESIVNIESNSTGGSFALGCSDKDGRKKREFDFSLRRAIERYDRLGHCFVFNALSGGTGSGLGTLVINRLEKTLGPKVTKGQFALYPSDEHIGNPLAAYNAVFHEFFTKGACDWVIGLDNTSLARICMANLRIQNPRFANFNRLISQVMASISICSRSAGKRIGNIVDLGDVLSSAVPIRRMHHLSVSYGPLRPILATNLVPLKTIDIIKSVFAVGNQMISFDPRLGSYLSCVLINCGHQSPGEIDEAILTIKKRRPPRFADWIPNVFRWTACLNPPSIMPGEIAPSNKSVCMIGNSTAISQIWTSLYDRFEVMARRAFFTRTFVEYGFEQEDFISALQNIKDLEGDYEDTRRKDYSQKS